MPADLRKRRTLKALSDQLVGLAAKQPVLFVLEDAHWIDPTTRELMDELMVRISDGRVLALITHRPEFSTEWTRHPHVTVLTLNRLGRAQGAEMVRAAGAEALPEEVMARILRRCDGVPLFIEELTRSVLETGGRRSETEVPETLQGACRRGSTGWSPRRARWPRSVPPSAANLTRSSLVWSPNGRFRRWCGCSTDWSKRGSSWCRLAEGDRAVAYSAMR